MMRPWCTPVHTLLIASAHSNGSAFVEKSGLAGCHSREHTLAKGARQLVVQDALEMMVSFAAYSLWFTPTTYMLQTAHRNCPLFRANARHSYLAEHRSGAAGLFLFVIYWWRSLHTETHH